MKNKALTYLLVGILSLSLLGCGKKEEPTVPTEVVESVETVEVAQQETVSVEDSIDESASEETEQIELSKYELMSQDEFGEFYSILQGYFVNNDVTYFYYSYVKDGEVIYFYTKSDEPDNWYTYKITSTEIIGDASEDNQYINHKTAVTVTDSNGNVKEMVFNLLLDTYITDTYNSKYTLDIVDGNEVINLQKLSNDNTRFGSSYKYLKFVDLDIDESGNITLEMVDVSDCELCASVDEELCFNATSNSYYSFVFDGDVYIYDKYYENGFENIESYLVFECGSYPVEYMFVNNPYLENNPNSELAKTQRPNGNITFAEELLAGYSFRVSEEQYLTYNGVEGLVLGEYVYYKKNSSDLNVHINLVTEDGEEAVRVEFEDTELFEKASAGEVKGVSGRGNIRDYFEGEDYFVYYDGDAEAEENTIVVLFNKDGLTYRIVTESDELDNEYIDTVAELRKVVDAFAVSGDEQTVDDYLKETIKFGEYSFAEDVRFEGIYRGETTNGFERLEGEDFTYYMNYVHEDEEYTNTAHDYKREVYDEEFIDEFLTYAWSRDYTLKEQRIKEYKRIEAFNNDEPQKVLVIGQGDGFSINGRTPSEIEEGSLNYLMNKLKKILVKN